jgi:hypothetical protein
MHNIVKTTNYIFISYNEITIVNNINLSMAK